jgi:ComF family protein
VPRSLEQLLLPAECLLCQALLPFAHSDDVVCGVCRHRWRRVTPPWCTRCGQPEPHFGPCRLCAEWVPELREVRSAVWLAAGARDAVHALKYGHLPRIAADLAAVMARHLLRPAGVLVPVPLDLQRARQRGYNQSLHLARELGRCWELPVADVLERTRRTVSQTTLTPAARQANVAGAFRLRNSDCGLRIDDRPANSAIRSSQSAIVLVDDVFTTGSTLAACARALAESGAREITAVTFGRAVIPDFS